MTGQKGEMERMLLRAGLRSVQPRLHTWVIDAPRVVEQVEVDRIALDLLILIENNGRLRVH